MRSQDFFGSNCANVSLSELGQSLSATGAEDDTSLPYTVNASETWLEDSGNANLVWSSFETCVPTMYLNHFTPGIFHNSTDVGNYSPATAVDFVSLPSVN